MENGQSEKITSQRSFADRIEERHVGPCRLYILPTPVDSVVSWHGSFCTYPDFAGGQDLLQDVTVSLLDKGTHFRDRFAVAEVLEDRGAELSFSGQGVRVKCRGRALWQDLDDVLEVMAEQLREPLFDPQEFKKAKAQAAASLQRSLEKTGSQAAAALSRCLYGSGHPNYSPDPRGELESLQKIDVDQVRDYHRRHFGANQFALVLVGDVDVPAVEKMVANYFGDWPEHQGAAQFETGSLERPADRVDVPMQEKDSIDVRLGHGLGVLRQDDDYLPLYIANYILGGNFSARLMASVRDEMGLTYGIGSRLSGVHREHEGHWQIGVTLSKENLKKGTEATLDVVRRFVKEGATAEELEDKKTTITGSFKVGLATTGGLARTLLRNIERGFSPSYLDDLPDEVRSVDIDQLNAAVRRHFHPDRLHLARAGMLEREAASTGA